MRRRTFVISSLAGMAAGLSRAQSAGWPTGPVRLMVGFPPGGGTDVLARLLAQKLAAMWKATIVVDNKAGAAGTIAADQVAKSQPDGLNLLMAHISSHGIAPGLLPRLGYSAERDFTPIGLVGATPQMLICGAGQSVKTLPALIELCRRKPGEVTFGSAGNGSAQHLALELFKARAKIEVLHIPYKGSAPMITDMLGGQIQYAFEGMTTATTHLKGGRIAAIAQTRPKRSKSHPGVPTLAELGFEGFDASIWFGLVGPAHLPPALVTRINVDLNAVLAQPDVIEMLDQFGAEDGGGSPKRFGDFMSAERTKWAQIIKAGHVTPDS